MSADAYAFNFTTGVLTKNSVAVPNLLEVKVFLQYDNAPGLLEGTAPVTGFTITARVHDTAADARILAQGPSGLLGSNVAAFAGTPSRYVLTSKTGDTLALTGIPGTITASALEGQSADGFAP